MKKSMILSAAFVMAVSMSSFAADGAATYKAKCAGCHGADGTKANPGMGITPINGGKKTDKEVEETITKGKGKMPAYGGKLSDEEIKAVAAFVKTLK
jgi:cytochrome c6